MRFGLAATRRPPRLEWDAVPRGATRRPRFFVAKIPYTFPDAPTILPDFG